MTNLSDVQAALVAANVVLADIAALSQNLKDVQNMLQQAQASAAPISPAIMTAQQAIIAAQKVLTTDITAAVAAIQVVVTDLGG